MKKLSTDNLSAGMVVAKEIVTRRGQTIAEAGTVLTDQMIARLSFYRITEVCIEEPKEAEEAPAEKTAAEAPAEKEPKKEAEPESAIVNAYASRISLDPKYQQFQILYTNELSLLKDAMQAIIDGDYAHIHRQRLMDATAELFASRTSLDLFDLLRRMRALDDTVYAHSVNVAMISRAIGRWLKFSRHELDMLTLAALFHDIGKTQIPEEVLNKQGKLTDQEFALIRQHPLLGSKLLKKIPKLDARIPFAALQHHERFDGSGYPRGLTGDEIDDFAAIIAIADVYDAMTSARTYRTAKCAFQVIAAFEDEGLSKYNPKFILTFLQHMASSYQNSRVFLSDGRSARIVYINSGSLSRPIVQLDDHSLLDLSKNPDLSITAIS